MSPLLFAIVIMLGSAVITVRLVFDIMWKIDKNPTWWVAIASILTTFILLGQISIGSYFLIVYLGMVK